MAIATGPVNLNATDDVANPFNSIRTANALVYTDPTIQTNQGGAITGTDTVIVSENFQGNGNGSINLQRGIQYLRSSGSDIHNFAGTSSIIWNNGLTVFLNDTTTAIYPFIRAQNRNTVSVNFDGQTFRSIFPNNNTSAGGINITGINLAQTSIRNITLDNVWANVVSDIPLFDVDFSNIGYRNVSGGAYYFRIGTTRLAGSTFAYYSGDWSGLGGSTLDPTGGIEIFNSSVGANANYQVVFIDVTPNASGNIRLQGNTTGTNTIGNHVINTVQAWRPQITNAASVALTTNDFVMKQLNPASNAQGALFNVVATDLAAAVDFRQTRTAERAPINTLGYWYQDQVRTMTNTTRTIDINYTDRMSTPQYIFSSYDRLIEDRNYARPLRRATTTAAGKPTTFDNVITIVDPAVQGVSTLPPAADESFTANQIYRQWKSILHNSTNRTPYDTVFNNSATALDTEDHVVRLDQPTHSVEFNTSSDPALAGTSVTRLNANIRGEALREYFGDVSPNDPTETINTTDLLTNWTADTTIQLGNRKIGNFHFQATCSSTRFTANTASTGAEFQAITTRVEDHTGQANFDRLEVGGTGNRILIVGQEFRCPQLVNATPNTTLTVISSTIPTPTETARVNTLPNVTFGGGSNLGTIRFEPVPAIAVRETDLIIDVSSLSTTGDAWSVFRGNDVTDISARILSHGTGAGPSGEQGITTRLQLSSIVKTGFIHRPELGNASDNLYTLTYCGMNIAPAYHSIRLTRNTSTTEVLTFNLVPLQIQSEAASVAQDTRPTTGVALVQSADQALTNATIIDWGATEDFTEAQNAALLRDCRNQLNWLNSLNRQVRRLNLTIPEDNASVLRYDRLQFLNQRNVNVPGQEVRFVNPSDNDAGQQYIVGVYQGADGTGTGARFATAGLPRSILLGLNVETGDSPDADKEVIALPRELLSAAAIAAALPAGGGGFTAADRTLLGTINTNVNTVDTVVDTIDRNVTRNNTALAGINTNVNDIETRVNMIPTTGTDLTGIARTTDVTTAENNILGAIEEI